MPELPEVEAARRALAPAMAGHRFERIVVRRPDLRIAFPTRFAERLTGLAVTAVDRRAKYLIVPVSSGETLVMHLGMTGSFSVERRFDEERLDPHDHVIFEMSSGTWIVFNDARRFGLMDLIPSNALASHPALSGLGPEPLSREFDGETLSRACRGRKTSLKVTLLDQRVVAGLGNIYAAEALHVAGLSPLRRASSIAAPSGAPRESAIRLAGAIKKVLTKAIERQTRASYRNDRFRVYDREGEPCRRLACRGSIRRITQGGRSTFYCPVCQR